MRFFPIWASFAASLSFPLAAQDVPKALTPNDIVATAQASKRASRKSDFHIRPAGGADACSLPVPMREAM